MAQAKTKVLTAQVPLQIAEKVDQMASRLERSRGGIMKQTLSAWIDQGEERSRLTKAALVDVDAGLLTKRKILYAKPVMPLPEQYEMWRIYSQPHLKAMYLTG